ncbi:hypothetical protein ACFL2J_04540 [Candidatus Omnitrophota bacterium]
MKKKIAFFILLFAFVCCREAFCDTLYLKNGTQFKGSVVKQDEVRVIFSIGEEEDSVEATFFNEEILRIDKTEVSSFISVPFGDGQQIDFPRPIFSQEPMISEQVKAQRKQKAKIGDLPDEEEPDLEIIKLGSVETETEESEQTDDQEESEQADDQREAEQPQAQGEAESEQGDEGQDEGAAIQDADPQPDIKTEALSNGINTDSESIFQGSRITEELSELLDEAERKYFLAINSLVQGVTGKMTSLLANPDALTQQPDVLNTSIEGMPAEVGNIIDQLEELKVPDLFVDFHNKYLSNLSLMKDVFNDMTKGDVESLQTKIQSLQEAAVKLQEELNKILSIKKVRL